MRAFDQYHELGHRPEHPRKPGKAEQAEESQDGDVEKGRGAPGNDHDRRHEPSLHDHQEDQARVEDEPTVLVCISGGPP